MERRISDDGILTVELVRMLNVELGVSVEAAVAIAMRVHDQSATGSAQYQTPSGLVLTFPLEAMRQRLRVRLSEAIESIARIPRGRPRNSRAHTADE